MKRVTEGLVQQNVYASLGFSVILQFSFFNFVQQRGTVTRFENPSRHKHKRVCLELHSVVRMKMLYKRWKTFKRSLNHAEVERTELAGDKISRKELNFRWRFSEISSKSPYAAKEETYFVVNDKEKRRLELCR